MTGGVLFSYVLPLVAVVLVAATSGGLIAWWLLRRQPEANEPRPAAELAVNEFADTEFVDAEIDLASVQWQEANSLPPAAAGLMAARLKTLHMIGKGKGWF